MKFVPLVCILAASMTLSGLAENVPKDPNDACPIMMGESLPELPLKLPSGKAFSMAAALTEKPAVLLVYRGGWCPYCNTHLADIQQVEKDLRELGFQIIAVSPDRPELLTGVGLKNKLHYTLLSDSSMEASRALGIAFQLDQATVDLYKNQYGIDVEADSGETHHQLPIPSAFIIGQDGTVQFAYVSPAYKSRISSALLLEAARSVAPGP